MRLLTRLALLSVAGCAGDPAELKEATDLMPVAYEASIAKKHELYDAALDDLRDKQQTFAARVFGYEVQLRRDADGKVLADDVIRLLDGEARTVVDPDTGKVETRQVGGLVNTYAQIDRNDRTNRRKWDEYDPNKGVFYELHGILTEWQSRTGISQEQQEAILRDTLDAARKLGDR